MEWIVAVVSSFQRILQTPFVAHNPIILWFLRSASARLLFVAAVFVLALIEVTATDRSFPLLFVLAAASIFMLRKATAYWVMITVTALAALTLLWILFLLLLLGTARKKRNRPSGREGNIPPGQARRLVMWKARQNVPRLTGALNSTNKSIRAYAAEALCAFGDARCTQPLVKALTDYHYPVRYHAVRALRRLKDPRAVPALIRALDSPESGIAIAAVEALAATGDARAVQPLISLLQTSNEEPLRLATIRALGRLKADEAVEPLSEILNRRRYSEILAATEALKAIGSPRAIPALISLLGYGYETLRLAAADALAALGETRLAPLIRGDADDYLRLAESGDPRVPDILLRALTETMHVRSIAEALAVLGDPRAVKPLAQKLSLRILENEAPILSALVSIGDPGAAEHLAALLDSGVLRPDPLLAETLMKLHHPRGTELLLTLIAQTNPAHAHTLTGAILLLESGDERIAGALETLMCNDNDRLRAALGKALAHLGRPQWADVLRGNANDFIRLYQMGLPQSAAALKARLSRGPERDRRRAAKALLRLDVLYPDDGVLDGGVREKIAALYAGIDTGEAGDGHSG